MGSLRTRLVLGLLAVSAVGLLALATVTYVEQRSFLIDRVDQQARAALGDVARRLDDGTAGAHGGHDFGRGGPGGPGGDVSLPSGTYGQQRDASGAVTGTVLISYGETGLPKPDIPADLPSDHTFTVDALGGSGTQFRVLSGVSPDRAGVTLVAVPLHEVGSTLDRLLLVEAIVIAVVLLVLAFLAWWVVKIGLRPLDRIGETAGAIAGGDLSRRVSPATEKTEVGRLGLALNRMLERLEGAFAERQASEDRLRTFLADAAHELRTPLASVRGYAELLRIGAASEPADVERAQRRIEEEAARMGVLVEDMLTLARLDEIRDGDRRAVDVVAIATDAVDDACAVAPDRAITMTAAPGADASILADAHQLRQVVGNLLRNALVHTPAGTPVEVAVTRQGDEECLVVRDHGPGLPSDEADALFERFWRAEPGRGRGRAGAGLGLAIVAGIVEAHGGRVQAANAPGGGAVFTVWLPASPPAGA